MSVAAAALAVGGVSRLWARERPALALPTWVTPRTAVLFGLLVTVADLPNAFAYLIAIERLIAAEVTTAVVVATLAAYTLLHCLPCLLLALGLSHGERTRTRLMGVYDRFGSARRQPRSIPLALILLTAAAALLACAWR